MPTKMKGLLKGPRCISHIFGFCEYELSSMSAPMIRQQLIRCILMRMSKFHSTPQLMLQPVDPLGDTTDPPIQLDAQDSPRHQLSTSFGSPQSSPSEWGSDAMKHARQHRKSAASADAPPQKSLRKSKGSSGGGWIRTLRSKGQTWIRSEHGQGLKKIQSHLRAVAEVTGEGKGQKR
ncbi:hypothetical protein ACJRO7_031793 [Eucalyptus globulus]|uniref:Uncharacterized protein n=1 Tax=Eucalyptus globulus TaxID=34317 RepID=A0ABD3JTX4_EUCGL